MFQPAKRRSLLPAYQPQLLLDFRLVLLFRLQLQPAIRMHFLLFLLAQRNQFMFLLAQHIHLLFLQLLLAQRNQFMFLLAQHIHLLFLQLLLALRSQLMSLLAHRTQLMFLLFLLALRSQLMSLLAHRTQLMFLLFLLALRSHHLPLWVLHTRWRIVRNSRNYAQKKELSSSPKRNAVFAAYLRGTQVKVAPKKTPAPTRTASLIIIR
jgi:hypothetical protein